MSKIVTIKAAKLLAISSLVVLVSTGAHAASCLFGSAAASPEAISAFKSDPASIFSAGSSVVETANLVRLIAASDDSTLSAILDLAVTATPAQKAAIGSGLARAASACSTSNPEVAALIQSEVAKVATSIPELEVAFRAGTSDIATAALGGDPATTITPTGDGTGTSGFNNGNGNGGGSNPGNSGNGRTIVSGTPAPTSGRAGASSGIPGSVSPTSL